VPGLLLLSIGVAGLYVMQRRQTMMTMSRLAEWVNEEAPMLDAAAVRQLLELARDEAQSPAACWVLGRAQVADAEALHAGLLKAASDEKRTVPAVNLLRVLALRESPGSLQVALQRLRDPDLEVQKAAWTLVGVAGTPELLADLLAQCESIAREMEPFAEEALAGIVLRADQPEAAAEPLVSAYTTGLGPTSYRALLVRVLGRVGGEAASFQLKKALKSEDVAQRRAAIGALALSPSSVALELLVERMLVEADPAARLLLIRAAAVVIGQPGRDSQERRLNLARQLSEAARDSREKSEAVQVLSRVAAPDALVWLDAAQAQGNGPAGPFNSARARVQAHLAKLCVAKEGRLLLEADAAIPLPGSEVAVREGALDGWAGKGDGVEWVVRLDQAGRHRLMVEQAQSDSEAPWVYEVRFAGEVLVTRSVGTGSDSTWKTFEIGTFSVPEPGHHRLSLHVRQAPPGASPLRIKRLELRPVDL
jgi:hypothetical protein